MQLITHTQVRAYTVVLISPFVKVLLTAGESIQAAIFPPNTCVYWMWFIFPKLHENSRDYTYTLMPSSSLQELFEACDSFDKASLSRLTD